MRILTILPFAFFFVLLHSCKDVACGNSNPVFDEYLPHDLTYQQALMRQLQVTDNAELDFFVEGYKKTNNAEFLSVAIKGDALCAIGTFMIDHHDKALDDVRQTKGKGYRGARLKNFKYLVEGDQLVFKSVDAILD